MKAPELVFTKLVNVKSPQTIRTGWIDGSYYEYFPNGRIYQHREYFNVKAIADSVNYLLKDLSDTAGVASVTDGEGTYIGYNNDYKQVTEQGPIKNGVREGTLTGGYPSHGVTFEEIYSNGKLLSGKSTKNGQIYTYTNPRYTPPRLIGKEPEFMLYMAKNYRYPGQRRELAIHIIAHALITADGLATNIRANNDLDNDADEAAIKLIKKAPKWMPATEFGMPVAAWVSANFVITITSHPGY
jgi:hypothetical protein